MRKIDSIILHCTATKVGQKVTVEDIRRWHVVDRSFSDIGYHFLIMPDGEICEGRDIKTIGAHCLGHNETSIGIAYIGGLNEEGKPADTRTNEQKEALLKLVNVLSCTYKINYYDIRCHNEFAKKACPCFSIEDFRAELADYLNSGFFSVLKQEVCSIMCRGEQDIKCTGQNRTKNKTKRTP